MPRLPNIAVLRCLLRTKNYLPAHRRKYLAHINNTGISKKGIEKRFSEYRMASSTGICNRLKSA